MVKQDLSVLLQRAKFMDSEAKRLLLEQTCAGAGFVASALARGDAAPEVLRDAYRLVFGRLSSFEDGGRFAAAVSCAAASFALRAAKEEDAPRQPPRFSGGKLSYKESQQFILWAFGQLADEQRAMLLLRGAQGIPADQAARALGVSEGTARKILHAGRENIRKQVKSLKKAGGALCESNPTAFLLRTLRQEAFACVMPRDRIDALWREIDAAPNSVEPSSVSAPVLVAAAPEGDAFDDTFIPPPPREPEPAPLPQTPPPIPEGRGSRAPARLIAGIAIGGLLIGAVIVAVIYMMPKYLRPRETHPAYAGNSDVSGTIVSGDGDPDSGLPASIPEPEEPSLDAAPATGGGMTELTAGDVSPVFAGGFTLDFPASWCGRTLFEQEGDRLSAYHKQIYEARAGQGYDGLLFTLRVMDVKTYEAEYGETVEPVLKAADDGERVVVWVMVTDPGISYEDPYLSDYNQMSEEILSIMKTCRFVP